MALASTLAALGAAGVRLALDADRLRVVRPERLDPRELAPLRADPAAARAAVARMDAVLAEALAVLDDLAERPGRTPARLEAIRLRAEVYRECRDRLDATDLAGDARHFADCVTNPPPRAEGWLDPRDCRPSHPPQEATR